MLCMNILQLLEDCDSASGVSPGNQGSRIATKLKVFDPEGSDLPSTSKKLSEYSGDGNMRAVPHPVKGSPRQIYCHERNSDEPSLWMRDVLTHLKFLSEDTSEYLSYWLRAREFDKFVVRVVRSLTEVPHKKEAYYPFMDRLVKLASSKKITREDMSIGLSSLLDTAEALGSCKLLIYYFKLAYHLEDNDFRLRRGYHLILKSPEPFNNALPQLDNILAMRGINCNRKVLWKEIYEDCELIS